MGKPLKICEAINLLESFQYGNLPWLRHKVNLREKNNAREGSCITFDSFKWKRKLDECGPDICILLPRNSRSCLTPR